MRNKLKTNQSLVPITRHVFLMMIFLFLSVAYTYAQQRMLKGSVYDENNEPIIGASVSIKGTSVGTITDLDGIFSIEAKTSDILEVAYIGYTKQSITVGTSSEIKVVLRENNKLLDEVVVVGYGVQKRSDVTGAIASVSADQLTMRPVNNALEALQGHAPGVDITTNQRPGELGKIRIRGVRSLTTDANDELNDPLYVVDGIPLMSSSGIETLNPRDIESVDILKDASATAIFGSRGANGVVIVTTKQGKEGKFRLEYSGTLAVDNIVDKNPSMNASDYITYRRWAAYNADPENYASPYSPTQETDKSLFANDIYALANVMKGWSGTTWDGSKVGNTDWTDYVTQTGITHEHTLSASGGTDKMNAYGSFGYLNNEGTQIGQWYKRYTGKVSLNIKPSKWFIMNASINATWSEQDYGMSTLKGQATTVPNTIYDAAKALHNYAVPYEDDGTIIRNPGGYIANTVVGESEKSTQQRQTFRAMGNFSATLDFGQMLEPLKGLRYKINFGPDFRHWREGAYMDATSANRGSGANSWARLKNQRDFSWTLDNMITFDRTFAEKHKLGATLLQTASKWNIENSSMEAENIPRPDFLWNAFSNTNNAPTTSANKVAIGSGLSNRQLTSYMFRLNYGFSERYLVTVTGRWDGASQLADGHKWDFFPSASLAWRINQEGFLKETLWLDNLKARFGVGVTGNSAVDPYSTKGGINTLMLPFNGMTDYQAYATNEPYYFKDGLAMANPDMGWEKTTQYNVGIDFGILRNRISGSVDFYRSYTNDLLMDMKIPTLTGYASTTANVGKTKNKGVEFLLNFVPVQTKSGLTWESSFNAAYQKDEIVELAYGKNDMVDNSWFIGESLGVFYGAKNAGLWQDTPEDLAEMAKFNANGHKFTPGMVRPVDQDGNYKIDGDDRVILGNVNPAWTMGWTNTISWKGIEASIMLYSRMDYMVKDLGNALAADYNVTQIYNDYWTPENTNAKFQKPMYLNGDSNYSLLGYKDASFIKIRNISLGYNFPGTICKTIGLENLKLYGQCVNPGSLYQSISWYDLDANSTYYNRSFVFGLQIGF